MNQIHTVITAVGGIDNLVSKMLKYTLKFNIKELKEITIITDFRNPEIEKIANYYNINCIKTDLFYSNGAQYSRGKVLSRFLSDKNGWILHMDSDILLPKDSGKILEQIELNSEIMYGSRRIMFESLVDAENWYNNKELKNNIFCPLGFCYGYFQLFNMSSAAVKSSDQNMIYPDSGYIGEHDVWFRNKWGIIIDTDNNPSIFKIMGNLSELPFKIGHLGHSGVNNILNKNFFN